MIVRCINQKNMEFYKGFIICSERFYIKICEVDNNIDYEFKSPYLVEKNKDNNRKVYKLQEYLGNGNLAKAIDEYVFLKNLNTPKQPHSIVFDFWFNDLKKDAKSFLSIFGSSSLDVRFADFEDHFVFWDEFRVKNKEMERFITDNKIHEFFQLRKLEKRINYAKNDIIDYLL